MPLQASEQKGFSVRAQAVESCPSNAPRNAPSAAVGGVLSESLEVGTISDKLVTSDQWSSIVLRQMPFAWANLLSFMQLCSIALFFGMPQVVSCNAALSAQALDNIKTLSHTESQLSAIYIYIYVYIQSLYNLKIKSVLFSIGFGLPFFLVIPLVAKALCQAIPRPAGSAAKPWLQ